jgi:G3E family GTPase
MSIPVTVVAGFLGAGKTTVVNRLIAADPGLRLAVLVNDFGALDVDGALIAHHGGDTITFANGCLCCTIGDDLVRTVDRLLVRVAPPDHILIEASGVADPRPVADLAVLHPDLRRDAVVTIVDTENVSERLSDAKLADTVTRQLAAADIVVLNKCDLVDARVQERAAAQIRAIAPEAAVATAWAGQVPPAVLAPSASPTRPTLTARPRDDSSAAHTRGFASAVVAMDAPIAEPALRAALARLPRSVLRVKGFVRSAEASHALRAVHVVATRVRIDPLAPAGDDFEQQPALVVIGRADMPGAATLARTLGGTVWESP